MAGIAVGCGLMIASVTEEDAPPVAAQITAAITPAMSPLYDGQAVQDVADYAGMVDAANFAPGGGSISSVVVSFQGAASAADDPLVEDEAAGFAVTVTDTAGNQQVFTTSPVTVQYKARVTATSGNEAQIDVNPLVPDSATISLTVGNGDYAGTYTPVVGDLRGNAYNFGGNGAPTISGDTGLGDTLSVDFGLWSVASGSLSFTCQWKADGVDIPGATFTSFDITALQLGTDVTCEVAASDGTSSTIAETAAVPVSAGSGGALAGSIVLDVFNTAPDSTQTIAAADLTAAAEGDLLLFCLSARDNQSNFGITGVTFGGTAATLLADSPTTNPTDSLKTISAIYGMIAPAARIGDIVSTVSESVASALKITVIKVPGASITPLDTARTEVSSSSATINMDVGTGGLVVVATAYEESTTNDGLTYTGLSSPTLDSDSVNPGGTPGSFFGVAIAQTAVAASALAINISKTGSRPIGVSAISLQA